MDLAICIAVKNRSNLIVQQEDPIATYKHIADKIIKLPVNSTNLYFPPTLNSDGTITLNLLPKMLMSLTTIKRPTDNWTVIVVDYESTDFNVEMICKSSLPTIPYIVHTEKATFSRGTGLDIAATIAKEKGHKALFFCDSDMYFTDSTIFDKGQKSLEENKIFYPICFSFTLPSHEEGYWRHSGYGMLFIKTETYFNSSRWKHNISWGEEDNNLFRNFPKSSIEREKVNGYFHQWHPNSMDFKTLNYPIKEYIGKSAIN